MNPEEALTEIAHILEMARPATPGQYVLRILDKTIKLCKDGTPSQIDGVLAVLTSRDINEGPTRPMWNRIHDRFAIFQKRGMI